MADYTSTYNGPQTDRGIGLGLSSYCPTLQSAPTGSTLTFTLEGDTVSFRIGQFCRVADNSTDTGYRFYQLHDLQSNGTVAVWQEMGTPLERVTIAVTSNQSASVTSALRSSAVVTVEDEDGNVVYSGTMAQPTMVKMTPGKRYTVSASSVSGFTTPQTQTVDAEYEGVHSLEMEYQTELLTVILTSDTGNADLSGVTVTVTDTTASAVVSKTGNYYLIPSGHGYSVSVSDNVEGYSAPAAATGTAGNGTDATATVTMTYEEAAVFVDLGLSVKWAQANIVKDSSGNYKIGDNPEDYGCYFSWGNIDGHNSSNGSSFDDGYSFSDANYNSSAGESLTANIASNDATHDAALARLGSPWRMPTSTEFKELYDNTDREWTTINGVNGWKFMKKTDHSVFIFLPAAGDGDDAALYRRGSYGYYWSSTYRSSSRAYDMFFSSNVDPQNFHYRRYGFSVRAVQ